jgi:ClpP class serine protease
MAAAESNPNIMAHFMHISSGGGEAWLLDKAFETIWNTKKPVIAFIEKAGCSAAYYIASPADVVFCYTQNDTIGSIGTMIYTWDFAPYWIKQGAKEIEEYATKSKLKNKKFNDLLDGKPERYIKEELDPLQQQFEANVRKARAKLRDLPEDHPIFAGETYSGILAQENGLVDKLADVETAIMDAYTRGLKWREKNDAQNQALNYL